MDEFLTIALPKGRLGKVAYERFKQAGMLVSFEKDSRRLVFIDSKNNMRFLFVKPVDVITYVTNKVADIGIVGKDQIIEEQAAIYELMDLAFGKCRFAIAGFEGTPILRQNGVLRIATKYPVITRNYFKQKNQNIEIIPLSGSVELAPLVGLSDCIVDIVETGKTLKENGLNVLEEMFEVSARLISNRVSYRFKNQEILSLVERLNQSKESSYEDD